MLLADSINWPLAAGIGLLYLGPLTLVVSLIEAAVFSVRMKVHLREVFNGCLAANILSTFAGGIVSMYQGYIVYKAGITDTIPAFVDGFLWVCPILILIHFTKSVIVEGLILTRRFFLRRIQASGWQSIKALFIGNVLSYVLVGPLFYLSMRPHFAGLETSYDTKWVNSGGEVLSYIDPADDFIKRINMDGSNIKTLVPFPALSFQFSADESTFAFVGTDLALKVYRSDWAEPKVVIPEMQKREDDHVYMIHAMSLSPDHRKLAYRFPVKGGPIIVYDLQNGATIDLGIVKGCDYGSPLQWSADGKTLWIRLDYTAAEPNQALQEVWTCCDWPPDEGEVEWRQQEKPRLTELVENYGILNRDYYASRYSQITQQNCGEYSFLVYPYIGSYLDIKKEGRTVLRLQNEYGLINMGFPNVRNGVFLPECHEILVVWGDDFYVLDAEARKIGLLVPGDRFCLRNDSFRGLDAGNSFRR